MRKHRHVFHDYSRGIVNAPSLTDDDLQSRLTELHLDPPTAPSPAGLNGIVDPLGLPPGPPLPDQQLKPSVLSIGGQSHEPIPVIPEERKLAQDAVEMAGSVFRTLEDAKPPPASTTVLIDDQGAAGPDTIRLSMYNIPHSKVLREKTAMPLGLIARPFANDVVPHSDFASWQEGPPRCTRCRTYVNPAMQFTSGGWRFVCNVCLYANHTPDRYWQPLGPDGRRIDWAERPELASGVYDLEVSPETFGNGGEGPVWVFVVDCGSESANRQLPLLAAFAIREAVKELDSHSRIALISFTGHRLVLWRLFEDSYEMIVQSGPALDDPVVPPDIMFPPDHPALESLLNDFPEHADQTQTGSCYGAALKAAIAAIPAAEGCGGRILSIIATLPTVGPGRLTRRDPSSTVGTSNAEPEKELFACVSPVYEEMGKQLQESGIGVDLFAFPQGYLDLASVGMPAKRSGGRVHTYPRFVAERDSRAFVADLQAVVREPIQATHSSVAIRVSTGLQLDISPDVKHGIIDSTTTLAATLVHDGAALDPKLDVHVQVAVLYTNMRDGGRRIRVANAVAGVTDMFKAVLKYADTDTILALMVRQALRQLPHHSVREIRQSVLDKVRDTFAAARKNAGQGMPSTQLLMPTSLRELLPLSLALSKSVALGPRAFSIDGRVQAAWRLESLNPHDLQLALYPEILELPGLSAVRARMNDVHNCSVVLASDGERLWLYADEAVDLTAVLGEKVSAYIDELPDLPTPESEAAREAAALLMAQSGRGWLPLQLAREGIDGATYQFRSLMVEDPMNMLPSYQDYIQQVHRSVKESLKN